MPDTELLLFADDLRTRTEKILVERRRRPLAPELFLSSVPFGCENTGVRRHLPSLSNRLWSGTEMPNLATGSSDRDRFQEANQCGSVELVT